MDTDRSDEGQFSTPRWCTASYSVPVMKVMVVKAIAQQGHGRLITVWYHEIVAIG